METSIIMNTQVELSRNIIDYPFPHKLSKSESQIIVDKIKDIVLKSEDLFEEDFILYNIVDISEIEKNILIERSIISDEFSTSEVGSLIINKDKTKCIIINDQDHIKIKIKEDNYNIDDAYLVANKIDDIISEEIDYVFDDKLGYLTSRPSNAGTGLNVSVKIHLPILSLQRRIDTYSNIAQKIGVELKGIYNKNSNILGYMYEVSNQSIVGKSERNIIESVKSLTKDIIKKEKECRNLVRLEASIELEDEVYRSLGILQNARIISSYEAMKHLSNIKLGIDMDYIKDVNINKINDLMNGMKPVARLISSIPSNNDVKRADFLREEFSLANKNKK